MAQLMSPNQCMTSNLYSLSLHGRTTVMFSSRSCLLVRNYLTFQFLWFWKVAVYNVHERVQGHLIATIQYLKGAYKKDGEQLFCHYQSDNDRTRGNGFKLEEFRLEVRRKFFTQRVVRHWHRLPEKLCMPHPRRRSRPGWMGPWVTWSSGRCPCPWQRGWNCVIFEVPSNLSHSTMRSNKPNV